MQLTQDNIDTIITILGLLSIYATISYIDYKKDSLKTKKVKDVKYIEMEKDLPWLNQSPQEEVYPISKSQPDKNVEAVKFQKMKE